MESLIIITIIIILFMYLIFFCRIKNNNSESFSNRNLQNIYNQPLQPCRIENMSSGSWDNQGKCSETDGGVHQICINNIANNTPNFSSNTGQTNWSDQRGQDNHCVCLGAWSLYNANGNKPTNVLKCDAIPKIALTTDYVNKFSQGWNKWNDLELDNQIIDGVEGLVNNCYQGNNSNSNQLKQNYCQFASQVPSLQDRELYRNLCS